MLRGVSPRGTLSGRRPPPTRPHAAAVPAPTKGAGDEVPRGAGAALDEAPQQQRLELRAVEERRVGLQHQPAPAVHLHREGRRRVRDGEDPREEHRHQRVVELLLGDEAVLRHQRLEDVRVQPARAKRAGGGGQGKSPRPVSGWG
eukprot:gene767-biopygen12008